MGIKCRHCGTGINENWTRISYQFFNGSDRDLFIQDKDGGSKTEILLMNCPECRCSLVKWHIAGKPEEYLFPRMPYVGIENLPKNLKNDFVEACTLLDISPRASAVFSRKCLEAILKERGFKKDKLAQQIDEAIKDTHVDRGFPTAIRENLKIIQHFGNFSVHQKEYKNSNEIIDIQPEEAQYCIDLVSRLIKYSYEEPDKDLKIKQKFEPKLNREKKTA